MVRVSGSTMAPPTPCTARAAISIPMEGARAAAADADGEYGQADAEHPPPAEAIAEGGAGQEAARRR